MAVTAVGSDSSEPPDGTTGCWCCGNRTVQASVVRRRVDRGVIAAACDRHPNWYCRDAPLRDAVEGG